MTPAEFRRQVLRGSSQWQHGLSYRLRQLDGGGVALFSRPTFAGWTIRDDAAAGAGSLAADDCGRLFWMHRQDCQLYRRDPINGLVEAMTALAECDDEHPHAFGRMLCAAGRLWVLHKTAARLIAVRPDTFQILVEIQLPDDPVDVALGGGRLFTLHADGIRIYEADGRFVSGPHPERLTNPVAIGAGTDGSHQWIYVVDAGAPGFLRYRPDTGAFDSDLGRFADASAGFRPSLMAVHPDGNLFVSNGTLAHEFAPDGGYVGPTDDVSPLSAILGLAVDERGDLYAGSPERIDRVSRESGMAGNRGQFTPARSTTAPSTTKAGTEWISRRSSTMAERSTSPTRPPTKQLSPVP